MNKIRIGLLLESFDVPAWVYYMLEEVNKSGYNEIVLVVKKENQPIQKKSLIRSVFKNFRYLGYLLYRKFDNYKSNAAPDALKSKNVTALISQAHILEVRCLEKKFSDYFKEEDIETIKTFKIDVFIALGFRILRGDILTTAKFGIWSYHHGDNYVNRGGPAGFWEAATNWRETGSVLQILTEELDNGRVLYRSWSSVEKFNVKNTLNNNFWKSSLFVPRKLEELYNLGGELFLQKLQNENSSIVFYSNKLFVAPGNFAAALLFVKYLVNWVKLKIWNAFYFEQWTLLYKFNKNREISTSLYKFTKLVPPKTRFWADPFVVHKNDRYFVFLEEGIYKKNNGKAHIAVLELDNNGKTSEPRIILQKPYHLSYPFVFDFGGDTYMIPESKENGTIELYKAISFPYEWAFVMNLMENVRAVDTTLYITENKVWLFTTICKVAGSNTVDELFLFFADDLLTQNWQSHPGNPVVSDVKSARPAGKLFTVNDKLYRPSQDCSYKYGYAVVLNEVVELSTTAYKEKKITSITPNWDKKIKATHTLSCSDELTVIDALHVTNKFII